MSFLVDCPHCSTRVLPMAGRICPACRRNVDDPPDPEPPPEAVVREVYHHAIEQMREGVALGRIEATLTENGLDAGDAAVVIGQLRQARERLNTSAGQTKMLVGVLSCLAGIGVTAWTYQVALGNGGGTYVLAWGAILFGAVQFFRGLLQMSRS